jgi:GntR family transcriptional regulator, rspAB operon transcriptional repressor
MNLREQALEGIRNLIFSHQLEVGVRTSEKQIADKLGMSRTPVREALAILAEAGLVNQYPQVGVAVRDISAEEVQEILRLRAGIESVIVEELASQQTTSITQALHKSLHQLEHSLHDPSQFMQEDTAFHCQMAQLGGFTNAVSALRSFRDRLTLFRLTHAPLNPEEMRDIVQEHAAILAALETPSKEEPAQAIREHLRATQARLLERRKVIPMPGSPRRRTRVGRSQERLQFPVRRVALAASTAAPAELTYEYETTDGSVKATVQPTVAGKMVIAFETREPDLADAIVRFAFVQAAEQPVLSAEVQLQPAKDEANIWEGRWEAGITFTEPCDFVFEVSPHMPTESQ